MHDERSPPRCPITCIEEHAGIYPPLGVAPTSSKRVVTPTSTGPVDVVVVYPESVAITASVPDLRSGTLARDVPSTTLVIEYANASTGRRDVRRRRLQMGARQ